MPLLSHVQLSSFVSDGFILLPDLIPSTLLNAAQQEVDLALNQPHSHSLPPFYHAQRSAPVLALFHHTPLKQAVSEILGAPDLLSIRDDTAQIACTRPDPNVTPHQNLETYSWHVDSSHGRFAPIATDFLLLAGIAISENQHIDQNRGQLVVFPGSHLTTHSKLKQLIETTKNVPQVVPKFRNQSLDLGTPQRVLLARGEVILAHQRLAHFAGPNASDIIRTNVYFRIGRRDFPSFAPAFVSSPTPWLSFSPLSPFLPPQATSIPHTPQNLSLRDLLTAKPVLSPLQTLSDAQVTSFTHSAYIIIRNAVSSALLEKAARKIHMALQNGKFSKRPKSTVLQFSNHVTGSVMISDTFFKSGLVNIAERLLGHRNVVLVDAHAELVVHHAITSVGERETWDVCLGKGRFWRMGADCLLRVCLSVPLCAQSTRDTQSEDNERGQITVWPGSHVQTHEMIRDVITNQHKPEDRSKAFRAAKKSLNLGEGQIVQLYPGDAIVMHQRMATNFIPVVHNSIVEFPLQSFDFANELDTYQHSKDPFLLFQGLR